MSILAGHITAEQLTKFILYSEWLIYSTWWVGDNLSSLMQSIGASEKVFQLMDLRPSGQFVDKGEIIFQLASCFTYLLPVFILSILVGHGMFAQRGFLVFARKKCTNLLNIQFRFWEVLYV